MNKKEIMETLKLNEKDNKKKIVLIFIASLLAMAAAIYGIFRHKKSGKSGAKKTAQTRKQSVKKVSKRSGKETAVKVQQSSAATVQQPIVQQPVYVVRPLPEKKHESKARRFRRHMCAAVASILVISLVGSGTMNYVQPATVLAKGSFSGIGRIVAEHGADNPYVILDIVPSVARYSGQEFSTGTMGYLVNGQSSIAEDLGSLLKAGGSNCYSYIARQNLTDSVIIPGNITFGVIYEEAYGGTRDISENAGWVHLFDPVPGYAGELQDGSDDDGQGSTASSVPTGRLWAKVEEAIDGKGDFISATDTISLFGMNGQYGFNPEEGDYNLIFEYAGNASGDTVGGYVFDGQVGNVSDSFSHATNVYRLVDGVLVWQGTIQSVVEEYLRSNYSSSDTSDESNDDNGNDGNNENNESYEDTYALGLANGSNAGRWIKLVELETYDNEPGGEGENQNGGGEGNTGNPDGGSEENTGNPDGGGEENTGNPDGGGEGEGGNQNGGGEEGNTEGGEEGNTEGGGEGNTEGGGEGNTEGGGEGNTEGGGEGNTEGEGNPEGEEDPEGEGKDKEDPDDEEEPEGEENPEGGNSNVFDENGDIIWESVDWESVTAHFDNEGCIVAAFRYDPKASGDVYQIRSESPITGEDRPYDAYKKADMGLGSIVLADSTTFAVPDNDGETQGTYIYKPGEGNYNLKYVPRNTAEAVYVEVENVPVYFRCRSNNDWLKQYVFGTLSGGDNENSNFNITVNTVCADSVTPDMIQGADLIYLESGEGGPVLNTNAMSIEYFNNGDMSEDAVNEILSRAAYDLMPVIVDYDIVNSGNYKNFAYQYLAKALLKRDLAEFYAAASVRGTLLDSLPTCLADDKYPDKKDNNYNYVNQNVYIINDALVGADFADAFSDDFARAGFSDVLAAIKAENTMLSEENKISEMVSKARAVQYIINFAVGIIGEFDNLTILELQPTANIVSDLIYVPAGSDSRGTAKLLWKTEAMSTAKQILTSKKEFTVNKDVKSVAEFNGEWEDINGKYDIVFIGLDGQRLNLGNDEDRTPEYNNTSLNGKVYHTGDDSNTGLGKFDANDITAQKMTDLLEYMAAGYPVLVENNFFKDGSAQKATADDVDTEYIGDDTVMYNFLRAAVSEYHDCIYTVSDAMAGSMFMTQVSIAKPRISLRETEDVDNTVVQRLVQDENGEYHGKIAYEITDNRGDIYYGDGVIHLYADYDYDGVFEPEEEVAEYINDGGVLDVKIDGMGPGILPWKLEVSEDNGNANRRDSVQGYFELTSSTANELKVLQIAEKHGDDTFTNLQYMYHKTSNTLLAYYLRSANSDMQFETVTAAELETRLAENEKYLEQWDVVVLTLDGAANSGVVTGAVTDYVNNGRSLLVCGQDSGAERMGLSADLLGQMPDNRTYVTLGANGAGDKQRYADLTSDMYWPKTNLQAQAVNDGSISYYPYELGSNLTFGENAMKASEYLLDFEGNLKSENPTYVTAWYTFAGGEDTAFSVSPKDARNNYYCYSKGNVVYLAQSQYPYVYEANDASSTNAPGADECKFFVNALMAAYSAGVHNANVRIVAGFAPDSADVESIAVPFDQVWLDAADSTRGILDNTVDVYFRFKDNNIAMSKTVLVGFYYEDPDASEGVDIGGEIVKASSFQTPVWTVTNNRLTLVEDNVLEPGNTYRIQAPVITLRNHDNETKADIYIVLKTTFTRGGKEYTIISSDAVSLNRAQLFLLE